MNDRDKLKLVSRDSEPSLEHQVIDDPPVKKNSNSIFIGSFSLFVIIVTFIIVGHRGLFPSTLTKEDLGKISKNNITSTRNFTFVPDEELKKIKREEAAKRVRTVFSYRQNGWLDLWNKEIKFSFRALSDPIFKNRNDAARKRFNELMDINLDTATFWSLKNGIGYTRVNQNLKSLFKSALQNKILVNDIDTLTQKNPLGIEVRILKRDGISAPEIKIFTPPYVQPLIDIKGLRQLLSSEIETRFSIEDKDGLDRGARNALLSLSISILKKYISKSGSDSLGIIERSKITKARRLAMKKSVTYQPEKISKGDIIIKGGEPITLEVVKKVQAMVPPVWKRTLWFLGNLLIISAFFLIIGWFSTLKFGGKRGVQKDFFTSGAIFLLYLGLVRLSWYLVNGFIPNADPVIYASIFPAATAAFLIKILMGNRFAVFFSVAMAFLATWAVGAPVQISLFYFVSGLAASGVAERIEHRYVVWKSAIIIIGIDLLLVLMFRIISGELFHPETLQFLAYAVAGGLISGILMSAILPLVEYLGDYITDIKLLELTNTDHILLQELNEKAPGTYMHSQTVAQLGFSAAKKVGANALLVKVAAFYHDVGKTRQPKYFIENQSGENPHDKLKPSMSALVIKNHIKDTKEILEKSGIPKIVMDVAASHHGTTLIEYFFNRAKELAGEKDVVEEEAYRYPGPIPQTREAGILMLADAVEAAVRSATKKSTTQSKDPKDRPQQFDVNTIKSVVQSIINKKFTDGQLDASELTLRDLSLIAGSFITSLTSIHHERVSYQTGGEKVNASRRVSQAIPVVREKSERENKSQSSKNTKNPES